MTSECGWPSQLGWIIANAAQRRYIQCIFLWLIQFMPIYRLDSDFMTACSISSNDVLRQLMVQRTEAFALYYYI